MKYETLNPNIEMLNPKYENLNPNLEILNSKLETRNPKLETGNSKLEIFRVQLSQNQWILRHPHKETPIFTHPEKEEILRLLPLYFQRFQQNAIVKILDSFGRIMEERRFNENCLWP